LRKIIITLAAIGALTAISSAPAEASGGCGPYRHRTPGGACVPPGQLGWPPGWGGGVVVAPVYGGGGYGGGGYWGGGYWHGGGGGWHGGGWHGGGWHGGGGHWHGGGGGWHGGGGHWHGGGGHGGHGRRR
jgi:hypothetical protein